MSIFTDYKVAEAKYSAIKAVLDGRARAIVTCIQEEAPYLLGAFYAPTHAEITNADTERQIATVRWQSITGNRVDDGGFINVSFDALLTDEGRDQYIAREIDKFNRIEAAKAAVKLKERWEDFETYQRLYAQFNGANPNEILHDLKTHTHPEE